VTRYRRKLPSLLAPVATFAAVFLAMAVLDGPDSTSSAAPPVVGSGFGAPFAADTDERVKQMQTAVRATQYAAAPLAGLGQAYLQKARETGDTGYYSRADRAFRAALRRDPRELGAIAGASTLAGSRHDLREALERGLEARRLAPDSPGPYLLIADAQVELGRYRAAAQAVQRALDLKPTLASYARASYLFELRGELGKASGAMALAVSAGANAPENIAYVQSLLGDLELTRGRIAAAELAYRGALARRPGHAPALAGLARIEVAAGRLGRSGRLLERAGERLPLTTIFSLLAEVELAAGRRASAEGALSVVRAQQRLLRSAGAVPDADLVVFEATHGDPAAALRVGRRVWRAAPSVRSADALGWALTRSGRPRAGWRWARRSLRLGTRDPLFRFHAGMAALRAGRPAAARRELQLSLTLNPGFSPWLARQARAALEEIE
jgi:tetratricopeptide (TPR) repeat protein